MTYTNSSDTPSSAARTIAFRATDDAAAASNVATRTINITAVNDAPVVATSSGSASFTLGGSPAVVDGGLTISDPDSGLSGATVSISANLTAGDALSFTPAGSITGSYAPATGILTLSGAATPAQYRSVLRSVTYTGTTNSPATRTIAFQVTDTAAANSNIATRGVTIGAAPNGAPVVTTTAGSTASTENAAPVTVDGGLTVVDSTDTNLESLQVRISAGFEVGDVLTFTPGSLTGAYAPATGILTLSGTASVAAYEAVLRSVQFSSTSENPVVSKTIEFKVNDGDVDSNLATKAIAVTRVNDAPVVTTTGGATAYTENAAAVTVDGGLTVADPDDTNLESLRVRISAGLDTGDVLTVTPGSLTGSYAPATGILTLTGTATVAAYQTVLRSVKFSSTSENPAVSKTIEFKVNDGDVDSNLATKAIAVTRVNDAPVIATTAGSLAYTENAGPVVVDGGVTLTDADSAFLASATVTIQAPNFNAGQDTLALAPDAQFTTTFSGGVLTITAVGSISASAFQAALRTVTYTNSSDTPSTAARTIAFRATDDAAAASNVATRTINITAVNDAPVVTTSSGSASFTLGASPVVVDSGLTISDPDSGLSGATVSISANLTAGDALNFTPAGSITGVGAGTGTLTLSGAATPAQYQAVLRSVTYTGTTNSPATRTIAFQVTDTAAANSNIATRGVTIAAAPNSAPVVTTTAGSTAYTENAAPVTVDGGLTVVDTTIRTSRACECGSRRALTPVTC